MTVQEIFELRRQGRVEEAYEAIRPMYKVHKGYYTSLCMYLCARDVFNIRLYEGRTDEARKIFEALKRLVPSIQDKDGSVATFMQKAEERLEQCFLDKPRIRGGAQGGVLNHGQLLVLEAIKANEGIKVPGIEAETGIPAKSVERHIKVLIERRLIEHRGSKKTGGYHAL